MNNFNIIVVGDGGVGKTTLVNRWNKNKFTKQYIATKGVKIYKSLCYDTKFNIIDTAGQEKYSPISYNDKVDAAIIMFDVQSNISYKSIPFWHNKIIKNYGDIPIVICGNKVEVSNRKINFDMTILENQVHKLLYFSSKTRYNFEQPFMMLISKLLSKQHQMCKL